MANGNNSAARNSSSTTWTPTQGYILAVICLVIGIAVGYFIRGSASGDSNPAAQTAQAAPAGASAMGGGMGAQPSPEQLKHMADTQVQPMLAKLKETPNDAALLAEIGNAYYDAQVYPDAINYYAKALQIDPKNTSVRTDMGTAYWYGGNADRAISEFNTVLNQEPTKANTLFNRGMVRWQGKMDINGAVADWQKLLDTNPNYESRAKVQELIAKAKQHTNMKPGDPGSRTNKPPVIQ